jgi:hypothetical protein
MPASGLGALFGGGMFGGGNGHSTKLVIWLTFAMVAIMFAVFVYIMYQIYSVDKNVSRNFPHHYGRQ